MGRTAPPKKVNLLWEARRRSPVDFLLFRKPGNMNNLLKMRE